MTPQQKIQWAILLQASQLYGRELGPITIDNVDDLYHELESEGDGQFQDAINEVRWSGVDSGLPCDVDYMLSRHYEYKSVAAQMPDGSWVGWVFYTGGGKFGDPAAIEWVSNAYDVECTERPVMVLQRDFKIIEAPAAA